MLRMAQMGKRIAGARTKSVETAADCWHGGSHGGTTGGRPCSGHDETGPESPARTGGSMNHQAIERRVHPFYYAGPRRDWKSPPSLASVRDPVACQELTTALLERGIARPGETVLNMPPPEAPRCLLEWDACLKVDLSFVARGDFLLQCTRPPLSDIYHGDKKQVEPGNTDVERLLFRTFEEYLSICARSHVKLAQTTRERLAEHLASRCDMAFSQRAMAVYRELNGGRGWRAFHGPARTAAFLLRVDEAWKDGPGLIACFGMDSISTLAWAWWLRHELPHLLDAPGFSFFDLVPGELPERPTDLRWAASWRVEPVLEMRDAA